MHSTLNPLAEVKLASRLLRVVSGSFIYRVLAMEMVSNLVFQPILKVWPQA